MTYGNINGLHPELGSESCPYNLTPVYHLSITAWLISKRFVVAT